MNNDRDRVEALGVEQHRSQRGDDDGQRSQRIKREVPERGAQVQIAVGGARQHRGTAHVDEQPDHAHHEHRARVEVFGASEPANCFHHHGDRADEEQQPVGLRREHFGPLEAVRMALGGRALRERERSERKPERQHVGGEMYRVGNQREAAEQEPAAELDDEKRRVGRERDEQ